MKYLLYVLASIGAILLFLIILGSTPAVKEHSRKAEAIAVCWEEQGRKSLSDGERRSLAMTCERMEDDHNGR